MAAILARIPVLHESKASAISRPRPHPRWECWNKEGRTCMLMVFATSGTFGDGLVLFYPTFIPLTFFPTSYISNRFPSSCEAVQPPHAPSVRARIPHGVHERGVPRDKKKLMNRDETWVDMD